MLNTIERLKINWMMFKSIPIIFKLLMGRFYVFRDASDEIVEFWADSIFSEAPPKGVNENTISLALSLNRQAKAEQQLRSDFADSEF